MSLGNEAYVYSIQMAICLYMPFNSSMYDADYLDSSFTLHSIWTDLMCLST